eukprot:971858-Prymnesium_polylepis.1
MNGERSWRSRAERTRGSGLGLGASARLGPGSLAAGEALGRDSGAPLDTRLDSRLSSEAALDVL